MYLLDETSYWGINVPNSGHPQRKIPGHLYKTTNLGQTLRKKRTKPGLVGSPPQPPSSRNTFGVRVDGGRSLCTSHLNRESGVNIPFHFFVVWFSDGSKSSGAVGENQRSHARRVAFTFSSFRNALQDLVRGFKKDCHSRFYTGDSSLYIHARGGGGVGGADSLTSYLITCLTMHSHSRGDIAKSDTNNNGPRSRGWVDFVRAVEAWVKLNSRWRRKCDLQSAACTDFQDFRSSCRNPYPWDSLLSGGLVVWVV